MKAKLGSTDGYVFMACGVDAPCFVPEALVAFSPRGEATIDQLGYFLRGWSERNVRCSDADTGCRHLFPDETRPVEDCTGREIVSLLDHCRRLRAEFAAGPAA